MVEVTIGDQTFNAEDLEETLDLFEEQYDGHKEGQLVRNGIVITGDGWSDRDVYVAHVENVEHVSDTDITGERELISSKILRDKISEATESTVERLREYVLSNTGLYSANKFIAPEDSPFNPGYYESVNLVVGYDDPGTGFPRDEMEGFDDNESVEIRGVKCEGGEIYMALSVDR